MELLGYFFLSLVGSKPGNNRPRMLGIVSIIIGLVVFIQIIHSSCRHLISQRVFETNNDTEDLSFQAVLCSTQPEAAVCIENLENLKLSSNMVAFYMFIIAAGLQGMSIMMMYPIIFSYISDCTSPGDTAFYSGRSMCINTISSSSSSPNDHSPD